MCRKTEFVIKRLLTEVTLVRALISVTTEMKNVHSVLGEEDVARLTAIQPRLLDQCVYQHLRVKLILVVVGHVTGCLAAVAVSDLQVGGGVTSRPGFRTDGTDPPPVVTRPVSHIHDLGFLFDGLFLDHCNVHHVARSSHPVCAWKHVKNVEDGWFDVVFADDRPTIVMNDLRDLGRRLVAVAAHRIETIRNNYLVERRIVLIRMRERSSK